MCVLVLTHAYVLVFAYCVCAYLCACACVYEMCVLMFVFVLIYARAFVFALVYVLVYVYAYKCLLFTPLKVVSHLRGGLLSTSAGNESLLLGRESTKKHNKCLRRIPSFLHRPAVR